MMAVPADLSYLPMSGLHNYLEIQVVMQVNLRELFTTTSPQTGPLSLVVRRIACADTCADGEP